MAGRLCRFLAFGMRWVGLCHATLLRRCRVRVGSLLPESRFAEYLSYVADAPLEGRL